MVHLQQDDAAGSTWEHRRLHAVGVLAILALLLFGITACGGGDSAVDKSPDALNFSQESAADAGVYGAQDFVPSTEPTETEPTPTGPTAEGYSGYVAVQDENGAISFQAPTEWSDTDNGAVGPFQASVTASPDIDGLLSGWDVPGVFVAVSKSLGAQIAAAEVPEIALPTVFASVSPRNATSEDCDDSVSTWLVGPSVSDNLFDDTLGDLVDFGLVDGYSNCGGNGTVFIDFAGYAEAAKAFLYFQFTATSDADIEAIAQFLESLQADYGKIPEPSGEQTGPDFVIP